MITAGRKGESRRLSVIFALALSLRPRPRSAAAVKSRAARRVRRRGFVNGRVPARKSPCPRSPPLPSSSYRRDGIVALAGNSTSRGHVVTVFRRRRST